MMTQELNVCVLAAPLAAIDRRALSQAWYSALHHASGKRDGARQAPSEAAAPANDGFQVRFARRGRAHERATQRAVTARNENAKTLDRCIGAESDRRARRSSLARRIERKFLARSLPQRATFTAGGKRVHVVVQAFAGRVRLVAVCPPDIREAVARALAQARFALASRGVPCS